MVFGLSSLGLNLDAKSTRTSGSRTGTFNNTTTPIVPAWGEEVVRNGADRVNSLFGLDPYSLVAPAHDLHTQAAQGAAGLTGSPWNFDAGADLIRGATTAGPNTYDATGYDPQSYLGQISRAGAGGILKNLGAYMSPYRSEVVDAALADFDHTASQTRAQQDLDLAGSGAFGGSGAALTRSMTEGELARGRAATSANLRDQMFNRAAGLANLDADRLTQVSLANSGAFNDAARYGADAANAAGQFNAAATNTARGFNAGQSDLALGRQFDAARALAELSSMFDANTRQNIQTQAQVGDTLRGIDQDGRAAPIVTTQQIVAALQGLPLSLFAGENQQGASTEVTKGKTKELGLGLNLGFR